MKKCTAILIGVLANILLLSSCGALTAHKQKVWESMDVNPAEETGAESGIQVYQVESMENLKLGSSEFHLENYFIRNECQYPNHYYIDSDNVLWGYGDNTYGQLGNDKG